ncbi:MAG: ribonuclease domain-containing protein [Deltaproteobacteria bacterium]
MKKYLKYILAMLLIALSLFIAGCSTYGDLTYGDLREANDKKYDREMKVKVDNPFDRTDNATTKTAVKKVIKKPLTSFKEVADYIKANGKLPSNFITKAQAKRLGWDSKKGNLAKVAPGKSIGGDIFTNREKVLPNKTGRIWREADADYKSGFRNSKRILYSNDGLIYKTADHYKTFQRIY